jgi:hypothetical protein
MEAPQNKALCYTRALSSRHILLPNGAFGAPNGPCRALTGDENQFLKIIVTGLARCADSEG